MSIFDGQPENNEMERLGIDELIESLKLRKKENDLEFDIKMSELNLVKNEKDQVAAQAKNEEKANKIKTDLITKSMQANGTNPVMVGNSVLPPVVEPEARGLPILEEQGL